MKINMGRLFPASGLGLAVAIAAGLTGCAAGQDAANSRHSPFAATPTWSGDNHTPPVYTSPATTNLPVANTPP